MAKATGKSSEQHWLAGQTGLLSPLVATMFLEGAVGLANTLSFSLSPDPPYRTNGPRGGIPAITHHAAGGRPRGCEGVPIAIVGVADAGPGRPVPAVSPVVEFGAALHVLGDPGHHRSTAWAALIRASMSPRLAAWTGSWSWTAEAIRAAPLVTASPPTEDFLARVQALRLMPSRTVADQILRPISRPDDQSLALRWGRSRGPRLATVVETLVQRPDEAVADFLGFLEFSWHEWFAADWARIRPLLAARAREFADATAKQDAVAALTSIDPAVSAAPGGVVLAKIQNRRHDVARRGLLVVPSVFTSPHLYVADVPGQPLLLIHPAERGDPVPSVAELLRRLNVVAHPGRLDVARAIATEPRTAGEIAALWGMDATLVNRHLRALAAAGLAGTQRRGRFVQYRLNAAAVQALGTDLLSTLLR